ncbi:MAG: IclR family transcriptional regulator [Candidatus Promineifilaceae bacterium]
MDYVKEKYAGTQAVARTFQLINLFDDRHPAWSLADLIIASGLKRTTVFRLMAALEAEGIVRKLPTGNYMLGSGLIALGGRAIRANRLRTVAQPFLHELAHLTTESVTIDVLWVDEGRPESMVIEEHLGHHLLGMSQYIGGRFPAHTTSTGKVLLAFQSAEKNNYLNLTELERYTSETIIDPDQFQTELETVRQQGYAVTINELEDGVMAVAAPLFNLHGEVVAALSVGGPRSRISAESLHKIAIPLMQAASQISQQIGYEPS